MKKFILVIAAVLGMAVVASAQPRALGIRAGFGGELSYQHSLGENFAEFDLGWWSNGVSLAAAYDFSIAPVGPFNFYAGPAAHVFTYGYTNDNGNAATGFNLGIGAQAGLEYTFSAIPLQVSLDWRPMLTLLNGIGFGWNSLALGLRYAF